MRYLFLFVTCITSLQLCFAQNLVPNPSFEEVDSLPCWYISGSNGDPWLGDFVVDWTTPTGGTSDIWSTLVSDSCIVNSQRFGFTPKTGNNMAGIVTVEDEREYREYLQVNLKEPLIAGRSYYAEMYVIRNPEFPFANNKLGMYFTNSFSNQSTEFIEVLDVDAQVVEEEIISDTLQWQKISGCFTSEKDTKYLLIGNFSTNMETDTLGFSSIYRSYAYYFIDDVYVGEVAPLPENILGSDTVLCAGETLLLDAYVEGANSYNWLDFFDEPTFLVQEAGIYWVDITIGDCTYRDSITVQIEPAISLGKDTLLCYGESLLLEVSHPLGEYSWSDGSSTATLEVYKPGSYWVNIPSAYCQISDTIQVRFVECPDMIPNVFTPGNDEANETFYIANIENRQWQLRVFNRWGREVYFSDNYRNDWTGESLSSGVYFYYLSSAALRREYKGWVQLMRQHTYLNNP